MARKKFSFIRNFLKFSLRSTRVLSLLNSLKIGFCFSYGIDLFCIVYGTVKKYLHGLTIFLLLLGVEYCMDRSQFIIIETHKRNSLSR